MKKLKTIFSPRKIVLWLAIILLAITTPQINQPAMSQTESIVTMLFVDKKQDKFNIAVSVLAPGQEGSKNQQVYVGEGNTFSSAVDSVSIAVGREMGFAQCQIMGLGSNICSEGVMQALDYMTRTKKVGRNAVLISFEGDLTDFAKAVTDINTSKDLSLDKIINFDKRYLPSQKSNIETFYIGYFSDLSLGIMPKLSLIDQAKENAIEVGSDANSSGGASGGGNSGGEGSGEGGKKYLLNNGTTNVFKQGKLYLTLQPDVVEKMNIFVNNNQKNSIIVNNLTDNIYQNASVVVDVVKKGISLKPTFNGKIPVYKANVELTVSVEEVAETNLKKTVIRRNQDYLTPALVQKLQEKTKQDMYDFREYCVQNKVDLMEVYKNFYRKKNKQWEEYLNSTNLEDFLSGVELQIEVSIKSEF